MAYIVIMWSCHCTQSSHWRSISSVIDEDVLSLLTLCVGSGAVECKSERRCCGCGLSHCLGS